MPNGTRYTREKIDINIVDYVGMTGRYPTEVRLENTGNRAYTHAFGDVEPTEEDLHDHVAAG